MGKQTQYSISLKTAGLTKQLSFSLSTTCWHCKRGSCSGKVGTNRITLIEVDATLIHAIGRTLGSCLAPGVTSVLYQLNWTHLTWADHQWPRDYTCGCSFLHVIGRILVRCLAIWVNSAAVPLNWSGLYSHFYLTTPVIWASETLPLLNFFKDILDEI